MLLTDTLNSRLHEGVQYQFPDDFPFVCRKHPWVSVAPASLFSIMLMMFLCCSFLSGTLLVELVNRKLGAFDFSDSTISWVPRLQTLSLLGLQKTNAKTVGYSGYQARILGLLLSSILHGTFFIIMASRGGFAALFCAYVVAALARSVLTGKCQISFERERSTHASCS